MLKEADIDKKINLRHTYATSLLDAGAERVDIQALGAHGKRQGLTAAARRQAGQDGARRAQRNRLPTLLRPIF